MGGGGEDKADRRRGGEDNIRERIGLEFAKSQRAVENRENWRKLVMKSSAVKEEVKVKIVTLNPMEQLLNEMQCKM